MWERRQQRRSHEAVAGSDVKNSERLAGINFVRQQTREELRSNRFPRMTPGNLRGTLA
jgi:hypothetical protein